ncbi:MAG: hypothetical protein KDI68_14890 [Gammaproteobacteria bacterium]|nr:hypothetical protein [Gammaproteobacteria bacterium]
MQLPGGLIIDGERRRDYSFRAVTGELELELSENALQATSHPARVSAVLLRALQRIAGCEPNAGLIGRLSVGDRQFLMRRLAIHIDDSLSWLSAKCGSCGEPFDIPLRHSELPVKAAGEGYPEKVIESALGRLRVRVPSGSDQELVARVEDDDEALRTLLSRLIRHADSGAEVAPESLDAGLIALIESQVEAMAPEVATELLADCPVCQQQNRVTATPYASMQRPTGELFSEIHRLALHYHWGEAEILALPRSRRHTYLALIDRTRGMRSAERFIEG